MHVYRTNDNVFKNTLQCNTVFMLRLTVRSLPHNLPLISLKNYIATLSIPFLTVICNICTLMLSSLYFVQIKGVVKTQQSSHLEYTQITEIKKEMIKISPCPVFYIILKMQQRSNIFYNLHVYFTLTRLTHYKRFQN